MKLPLRTVLFKQRQEQLSLKEQSFDFENDMWLAFCFGNKLINTKNKDIRILINRQQSLTLTYEPILCFSHIPEVLCIHIYIYEVYM